MVHSSRAFNRGFLLDRPEERQYSAAMSLSRQSRRRLIGGIVIGTAILMVIAGEYLFKGLFSPAVMLFYWLTCFGLTVAAMIIAIVDASATARRTIEARRNLVMDTVKEIERKLNDQHGKRKD
jgi:hypothetical protein